MVMKSMTIMISWFSNYFSLISYSTSHLRRYDLETRLVLLFLVMAIMLLCIQALLPAASAWGPVPSFDCAMRKLAYQYGKQLIPRMGDFESLYYALNLNNDSTCPHNHSVLDSSYSNAPSTETPLPEGMRLFVHPISGDDDNFGNIDSPFRTIQAALDLAALVDPTPAVVLRGGIHYIADTLVLTPKHSGLRLIGFPGEKPTISGGVELKDLSWKPYNVTPPAGPNIYVTQVIIILPMWRYLCHLHIHSPIKIYPVLFYPGEAKVSNRHAWFDHWRQACDHRTFPEPTWWSGDLVRIWLRDRWQERYLDTARCAKNRLFLMLRSFIFDAKIFDGKLFFWRRFYSLILSS